MGSNPIPGKQPTKPRSHTLKKIIVYDKNKKSDVAPGCPSGLRGCTQVAIVNDCAGSSPASGTYSFIAQSVERTAVNREVYGSNPYGRVIYINNNYLLYLLL